MHSCRLVRIFVCLSLLSFASSLAGCGDEDSKNGDDMTLDMNGDTAGDVLPDSPDNDVNMDGSDPDMPSDTVSDSGDTSADGTTDTSSDSSMDMGDTNGCVTQTVVLAMSGTTSSCSFPLPDGVDTNLVNIVAGNTELCRRSTRNCNGLPGWFIIDGEVGLCDESCIAWTGNLVAEIGCATEDCTSGCLQPGEFCGNDGLCCLNAECHLGNCRSCAPAGEACSSGTQCCDGGTCTNGICTGGFGTQCTDSAGCTEGECLNYTCRCPSGDRICNGVCTPNDEQNCGNCGITCDAGEICYLNQCQCDPQSNTPDSCGGECVDTQTDERHCGFCNRQCLTGNKECIGGACTCGPGLTECNGTCYDTDTSQQHCGGCNTLCNPGTEVCNGGSCVCAPDYTDCSGVCRNLDTDRNACGACGNTCNGNRICVGGVCVNP